MKSLKAIHSLIILMIFFVFALHGEELMLRTNFQHAQPGDFIVISTNKTQTLLLIVANRNPLLTIEEISVPESKRPQQLSWKEWIEKNAPGNTSWVRYDIDLQSGKMLRYYSFTKKNWFEISDSDNFLSKLLNLRFTQIPDGARKRIGPPPPKNISDERPLWQPPMIVNGQQVKGVAFDAWRTRWPKDNTDLSGKTIEIFLPRDSQRFPAYFPYWLQITGIAGKAKVRIIDSGSNLKSPQILSSPS